MNAFIQKRINVARYWASTRISVLDGFERYEDSYAITQEFREWLTCTTDHPEHLEDSILKVPDITQLMFLKEKSDTDEMLEI